MSNEYYCFQNVYAASLRKSIQTLSPGQDVATNFPLLYVYTHMLISSGSEFCSFVPSAYTLYV